MSELAFDDPEWVFHLGPDAGQGHADGRCLGAVGEDQGEHPGRKRFLDMAQGSVRPHAAKGPRMGPKSAFKHRAKSGNSSRLKNYASTPVSAGVAQTFLKQCHI
jgi:hypothetical protein